VQEQQNRISRANAIAMSQDAFAHEIPVDERSVGTPEIAQGESARVELDRTVPLRHQMIRDAQVGARVTADRCLCAVNRKSGSTEWSGENENLGIHIYPSRSKQKFCRAMSSYERRYRIGVLTYRIEYGSRDLQITRPGFIAES
jgi:hypothetical protein